MNKYYFIITLFCMGTGSFLQASQAPNYPQITDEEKKRIDAYIKVMTDKGPEAEERRRRYYWFLQRHDAMDDLLSGCECECSCYPAAPAFGYHKKEEASNPAQENKQDTEKK